MTTVGEFTYEDGTVTGPAEYMKERGNTRLKKILDGEDHVFNAGARFSPMTSTEKLVLVSLQTDYAGWKGTRELLKRFES
jgi:hypothetical protein